MSKKLFLAVIAALLTSGVLVTAFWAPITNTIAQFENPFTEEEPDIPAMLSNAKSKIEKQEFLTQRAEHFGLLRGISKDDVPDPGLRQDAIRKMDDQEEKRISDPPSDRKNLLMGSWTAIGPAPIPNGSFGWSGRTISIDIHPTNPNLVYVGTAQGGLYRSSDGGVNWVPLMDGAMSLAIGAIVISPSDPETVYIGTGEHNFSSDSFFGVGVYRINNASTTATLSGPLNKDSGGADIFTGRGISRVIVHPTDPNTIFVATTSGVGGIGGVSGNQPSRGIYRSTNATAANPVFSKLTGLAGNGNLSVRDIAIDPNDANIMVAGVVGSTATGGLYRSTDALSPSPTFVQTQVFSNSTSTSEQTAEFAAIHPAADTNATFYAAVGNLGGRLLASTDGGATWTQRIDNDFCTPQCFYNIGVAVDPVDPAKVYLGGAPSFVFGSSTNGGTSFTTSSSGLHVDSHVIAVSKSNPSTIYFGSDGGIYKSANSGANWTSLNNTQFYATQFVSLDVHPTDPNFTIGGTQDNGTNYYSPTETWARVDGGDGGHAVIDQNAADLTNVRMYHTYFNSLSSPLVGYATRATTSSSWSFRGCSGSPANDINCNDTAILFYAPLERGPGIPNTIYYGSDRLYRSANSGTNHTVVSQAPISSGVAISAIGISPANDGVRLVGLRDGQMFGTINGSSTLVNLDQNGLVPNTYIARLVVDPTNPNVAYATLSAFGVNSVYKTTNLTNLGTSPVTWANASGTGATSIPQVPASGFAIDPQNTSRIFAGTDIGVYESTNAGATWQPFGTNLPRTAVFEVAITGSSPRKLRVATHGKGMYEIPIENSSDTNFDFDGDSKTDISIFRPGPGEWWYLRSSDNGNRAFQFGQTSDITAPADFTGDGISDVAFWRPSNGNWFILRSDNTGFYSFPFGAAGDIPAPGDFDGDGIDDPAVFRPSTGTWFIQRSSDNQTSFITFGAPADKPLVADYDNDGKDDIAVYKPDVAQFWQLRSTQGLRAYQFGAVGDKAMAADFSGDGTDDIAVWRPSSGFWLILRSEDEGFYGFPFGANGDIPAPGDYNGDGIADPTVFRPTDTTWYSLHSGSGPVFSGFGIAGDRPVPGSYVR